MPYTPIVIDREALTIMGVPFSDLEALENTAEAIGSNMFEGYQPTQRGIEIIRDYVIGKITFAEFIRTAVDKSYEK
jgi:putative transcriptional regulator